MLLWELENFTWPKLGPPHLPSDGNWRCPKPPSPLSIPSRVWWTSPKATATLETKKTNFLQAQEPGFVDFSKKKWHPPLPWVKKLDLELRPSASQSKGKEIYITAGIGIGPFDSFNTRLILPFFWSSNWDECRGSFRKEVSQRGFFKRGRKLL